MANFSSKLFSVAAAAMVFAGMASAQTPASCASAQTPQGTASLRAEGTTELVSEVSLTCTGTASTVAGNAVLQVFMGTTVTSKQITNPNAANAIEAIVVVSTAPGLGLSAASSGGVATGPGVLGVYPGVSVPGSNSINFPGVALPGGATTYYLTIANIRVNASALATSIPGIPPSVTEQIFVNSGPLQTTSTATVGYVQKGFSQATVNNSTAPGGTTTPSTHVICSPINSGNTANSSFVLHFGENFPSAFKASTNLGSANTTIGNEFLKNTESAINYTGVAANVGTATTGTRLAVTLSNIPSGITMYLPLTVGDDAGTGLAFRATTSATSGFSAPSASSATNLTAYFVPTVSGGTTTVFYEFSTGTIDGFAAAQNLDQFSLPVVFRSNANTVTATNGAVTALIGLAPTGSTNFPNFVATTNTSVSGAKFNTCTTSLLFPFMTNASGFDTGIAISNTSADPFGTANQPGTCTLNFYGTGAPAAFTTTSVAAGSSYTNLASTVAAGFQGYMIAQCAFQYAHGFAFITDGFGGPGRGLSQGYLAGVIPDTNQNGGRFANDPSNGTLGAGKGEILGH